MEAEELVPERQGTHCCFVLKSFLNSLMGKHGKIIFVRQELPIGWWVEFQDGYKELFCSHTRQDWELARNVFGFKMQR